MENRAEFIFFLSLYMGAPVGAVTGTAAFHDDSLTNTDYRRAGRHRDKTRSLSIPFIGLNCGRYRKEFPCSRLLFLDAATPTLSRRGIQGRGTFVVKNAPCNALAIIQSR